MSRHIVRCQDGEIRHQPEGFATLEEPRHWAWWGHVCAAHHDYEVHTQTTTAVLEAQSRNTGKPLGVTTA
jgi:hypothetical protein